MKDNVKIYHGHLELKEAHKETNKVIGWTASVCLVVTP